MILLIITAIILILDIYTFKGIKLLIEKRSLGFKRVFFTGFWIISGFMFLLILGGYFFRSSTRDIRIFTWYYYFFGVLLIIYVPKILFVVFHFADDMVYGAKWIIHKLNTSKAKATVQGEPISRSKFLSQVGIVLAAVPFTSFIWGIAKGRFNFRVERVKLTFPNLPKSFNNLRIAFISDFHIGGFKGLERHVEDGLALLNAQNPDIVFFGGDLVNNFSEELEGWIPILSEINAKYGMYSILGNHDYGNYYRNWKTPEEKNLNFNKIREVHGLIGFTLLTNQSEVLKINDEEIAIIGVENWGHPPFPQYADFSKAAEGVLDKPFKILLTHDPTYWDAKILNKTDVDLTFSGHTHGMQCGIRIAGKEMWSPAQYKYPHWAGLYREGKQYLYVNRGFGFIGYPGRVGMPPEITIIDLTSSKV
jgi:uncharacterized protein